MEELKWQKASYSGSSGGACVELARSDEQIVVRDSKDPRGPRLSFQRDAFRVFLGHIKIS